MDHSGQCRDLLHPHILLSWRSVTDTSIRACFQQSALCGWLIVCGLSPTSLVHRAAATCQVIAENESPETYEATKANHGLPLHVWRLDYGAFNGSGKSLGQLTAHFHIESEWPPCTNWTGLGQYPGPVQWAGSFDTILRTSGIQPGEGAAATAYVLALDGRQPRFRNWQVDYRFGAATSSVPPDSSALAGATVQPDSEPPAPPLPEPLCEGRRAGSKCRLELANQAGCYSWTDHYMSHLRHAWDGDCDGSLPSGSGTLRTTWTWGGGGTGWVELTGEMRGGREHGLWEYRSSEGGSGRGRTWTVSSMACGPSAFLTAKSRTRRGACYLHPVPGCRSVRWLK